MWAAWDQFRCKAGLVHFKNIGYTDSGSGKTQEADSKGISKRQKIDGPDILDSESVSLTHRCMRTYTPFSVHTHTHKHPFSSAHILCLT